MFDLGNLYFSVAQLATRVFTWQVNLAGQPISLGEIVVFTFVVGLCTHILKVLLS